MIDKNKKKKEVIRDLFIFIVFILATTIFLIVFPDKKQSMLKNSWNFFYYFLNLFYLSGYPPCQIRITN
jgi:hypothetical protein